MTVTLKIKPTFLTLVSFAFVVGLCGGVVVGIIGALKFFFGADIGSGFLVLLLAPIVQALQFALLAAIAFPLLMLWCKHFGYVRLEGSVQSENQANENNAL
jgi:hypothetical protein